MLIDMHVHTKEISSCASVSATEAVDIYAGKGYDAIVITNHINWDSVGIHTCESWESFVDSYFEPVRIAREYAEKIGFRVFFGAEVQFTECGNDYLVYGMTAEFMKNYPDIRELGIEKFHELAFQNDFLVYQAHPFRNRMRITSPAHIDGIEVYNANTENTRNDIAHLWAQMHGLPMISGSDFHNAWNKTKAGLWFFEDIKTDEQLANELRVGNYLLVMNNSDRKVYER